MHSIIFHAHQKLDRVAWRHLKELSPQAFFPSLKQILHFEAHQGPDGAKLKMAETEPWHFVDPHNPNDTQLQEQIQNHYDLLKAALRQRDEVRAAFEAAWLAHALVDGLTPAHHHPYERELETILGGEARSSRKILSGRIYVKADSFSKSIKQSLKLIGPKGLLTTHTMFEAGAYTLIAPLKLKQAVPNHAEIKRVVNDGVVTVFRDFAREIADLDIYQRFYAKGWTTPLSADVRRELAPRMVRMITLAWYAACHEAGTARASA